MKLFEKALIIAEEAHRNQKDKAGRPYILHPVCVANGVKSQKAKIVALLHDTVEDTNVTVAYLKETFGEEIATAVLTLTHDKNTDYFDYIKKVAQNPLAKEVKLADLKHNMDLTRLQVVTQEDKLRIIKYKKAMNILLNGDNAKFEITNGLCK